MQKIEIRQYGYLQAGLPILYRGKVQFNYVFVHVRSPQAGPRNLNGNRKPIHLFIYLFILLLLPIGTVAAY